MLAKGDARVGVLADDNRVAAPVGTSDLVAPYRAKVLRLSQELEAERQQTAILRAELATLRTQLSAASPSPTIASITAQAPLPTGAPPSDCGCCERGDTKSASHCASDRCIHKTALASRIIDRTFDDHKTLLRTQLREAQAELQRMRSGGVAGGQSEQHQAELSALRQALAEERQRCEGLQGTVRQMKIDQFMEKRGGGASHAQDAASSHGGASNSLCDSKRREGLLVQVAQQALMMQLLMRYLVHQDATMLIRDEWFTMSMQETVRVLSEAHNGGGGAAPSSLRDDPVEKNTHASSGPPLATAGANGNAFSRFRPRVPATHQHTYTTEASLGFA